MFRRILATFLVLAVVGLLAIAADWWFCLPETVTSEYVGRDACVECHEPEMELWFDSDHDQAMHDATAETVLGNFDDCRFTHISMEHWTELSDDEMRIVAAAVPLERWSIALHGAKPEIVAKVRDNLGPEVVSHFDDAVAALEAVRPADTAEAQDEIGHVIRRLADEGRVTIDFGVTSTLFRQDDKFFVTTDGYDGAMETFEVKYTFGVRPLQQYLVEFPDGRVQCLPMAWDTEKERWFHLYPAEPIPAGDELHWTRSYQTWNYMCAECHSTNLQKNYDLKNDSYHTTWSEIDVSCETCHGASSTHVELANSRRLFWDRRHGYGLAGLTNADPKVQIETCAPCHSRRRVVYPGFKAGGKFLDYYVPELLDRNLYYADGQILDEDYVYGSFIQSRMYREQVRCSDCHDPHSVKVKFSDNRLCGQCHVPAVYDTPKHHFHPDDSQPGTLCVECHMPETKYMVVDPRRDHSIRIPRPDLTISLGIPNACNGCHHDRSKGETAEWAEAKVQEWYGDRKEPTHFAYAIAHGREGRPEGERELDAVTRRTDTSGMVRASALALLGRYASETSLAAAQRGLQDEDPLVRVGAVRCLAFLPPEGLIRHLAPMLHDPIRAVRSEAVRLLSEVSLDTLGEGDREAFDQALKEYMTCLEFLGDRAGSHMEAGVALTNLGKTGEAEKAYRTALGLDDENVAALNNLGMLLDSQGRKDEAIEQFRRIVRIEPDFGNAHYSLGLLLAEDDSRLSEAAKSLGEAARLMSDNARVHYNYGLALQRLDRPAEAEKALRTAFDLSPTDAGFLNALRILYAQQGQWNRAVYCAEEMARRFPNEPHAQALLQTTKAQAAAAAAGNPRRPDKP